MNQQRIVSAAVRLKDGRVIMCVRHLDMVFHTALGVPLGSAQHHEIVAGHTDGFVDSRGEFFERRDSWHIADQAGQIVRDRDWQTGSLHSEHLY